MKTIFLLTAFLFVFIPSAFCQNGIDSLDRYVESARQAWDIPGMSVVVVQDGRVLLSKGYGVRELGKNDAVDSSTLFGAMSTTKAMTAVALGILYDERKIDPDEKVITYLPDFRVADPYITQELRVRDLFTHNSGIPSTDFLWARTPELSPDEAVRRMQYARPTYPFRGGFVYQNSMYLVAGKVIEKVSGMSWERFMTERVFGPLGMANTFPTLDAALKHNNRSSAHVRIDGKIEPVAEQPIDSVAPAGSVWSNADDMGKWINFLMTGKTPDGRTLIKSTTLDELFKPQVLLPSTFYPSFSLIKPKWTTYAFGWFQHDYRGEKVDMHTGSIRGRTAIVGLIRDKKLGVYVFGNLAGGEARHAIIYRVFDVLGFGDANGRDWNGELKKIYAERDAAAEKQAAEQLSKRLPDTKPSLSLAAYAGTYSDPFYGTVEVQFVDGKLKVIFAKTLTAELHHRHVDTFRAVWEPKWRGETLVTFNLNPVTGEVLSISSGGQTFRRQAK